MASERTGRLRAGRTSRLARIPGGRDDPGVNEPKPSAQHHHHRKSAVAEVPTAVLTVSDTRTPETDTGGDRVAELLVGAGHPVVSREIVPDAAPQITAATRACLARDEVRAVILTGGTGVAPRDVTPEAVEPLLDRVVPGFGELFRMLSYQDIGSAALLSRALAGLVGGKLVFVVPGSRGAVKLAMERLILPEIGHLAAEAVKSR
ncbi:MAG: MogA/MoaB family molybdenum cofactor biosynthesis protein [Deltaproteobacteria bacterium]|nr:MogA/MoaB family molybdenum cofactor biosynthesis protein [Deltaproteobacteria bacterium]MBW2398817.1 MogA/MoaB family molybdenum cofactor biosynthesis protein [Deltaproteobacteria bacterium]